MLFDPAWKVWGFLALNLLGPIPSEGRQRVVGDGSPIPVCRSCLPKAAIVAPGVGFDLSSTYATVSMKYENGTVVDVGRLSWEGEHEYVQLMRDLSGNRTWHSAPINPLYRLRYELKKAPRMLRKARGLPATKNINTLAHVFQHLWALAVESSLQNGESVLTGGVLVSSPTLPNLRPGDLDEALQYIGLHRLKNYKHTDSGVPLYQAAAAYAGMGNGLCEHWRDMQTCEAEDKQFKPKEMLALSYTNEELILQLIYAFNAHRTLELSRDRVASLGLKHQNDNPNFKKDVSKRIINFVTSTTPIEAVLVMGEGAEEKEFLNALWYALDQMGLRDLYAGLQTSRFNATYIASRGTAEMAKRWQRETWGCVEPDWCELERDATDLTEGKIC